MILSIINKYINLIFPKKETEPKDNISVEPFGNGKDARYVKLSVHNTFENTSLQEKLELVLKDELYKITIKVLGRGQNNETIIFHESVPYLVNKGNISDAVQTIITIVEKKKEYYLLDSIFYTQLSVFKVSKVISRKEDSFLP